jgi:hypothetical protein
MKCYKNKYFCDFKKCHKFGKCRKSITDKILKESEKFWTDPDYRLCMYSRQPKCFRVEARK